jgi:hypothetical protein
MVWQESEKSDSNGIRFLEISLAVGFAVANQATRLPFQELVGLEERRLELELEHPSARRP